MPGSLAAVQSMKRKEFLAEFLGALGAQRIEWHEDTVSYVSGRVVYDENDPDEFQDFCWHIKENETPNADIYYLAKLINEEKLLSIDKITVKREELGKLYNTKFGRTLTKSEFETILEELERIEVNMVDDGKETDIYFIHE